jgi:hypothetical protein
MNRKRLVYASRTVLIMLLVAALVVLGLGVAILLLGDPPEVSGWLRAVFGQVFAYVAFGLAAILGIPSAIGLWAMAGATAEDNVPTLPPLARQVLVAVAVIAVVATGVILLVTGSSMTILNLGLLGLVALSCLGLAGGAAFSAHRWRAITSGVALVLIVLGTFWVLNTAFLR